MVVVCWCGWCLLLFVGAVCCVLVCVCFVGIVSCFVLTVVCCCVYIVVADCCLRLALCDIVVCRMTAAVGVHCFFLWHVSVFVVCRICCLLLL